MILIVRLAGGDCERYPFAGSSTSSPQRPPTPPANFGKFRHDLINLRGPCAWGLVLDQLIRFCNEQTLRS